MKKTPITYYGGKQTMLKYIIPLIPEHKIYEEPFFGGGAVFFAKVPAKVEFINDTDGEVINFYKVVKENFSALKKLIDTTLHSEFQQKKAKAIYLNPSPYGKIERAWAVWVLSHQSFYSILDNTWRCSRSRPLSKYNQRIKEAFDEKYTQRLENTSIFCRDALDVIKKTDHEETFHYVDPPYFNADQGHYGGYTQEDFEKLLIVLSNVRGKFMLSSYPSDLLYQYQKKMGWHNIELNLPRAAGGGRKIEVLTMNYDIVSEQLNAA